MGCPKGQPPPNWRKPTAPEHDPYLEVLIVEVNGQPVCYSRVYWIDQPGKNGAVRGVYQSSTFTQPEWRAELGEAVLAFDEGRIRQPASEHEAKWLDNGIN